MKGAPVTIGGVVVAPGTRTTIELPVAGLYTHATVALTAQVVNGRRAGPCLFVSGAIHGDEINGVEIVRRLLRHPALKRMRGTLIAVPIVNAFGFLHRSRYLPDRRDLNRSFPGSEQGSLAGRLAHLFLEDVVARSTHGIDLHTAAINRKNLPQVRADLNSELLANLARSFGAPVVVHSYLLDGSLRKAACDRDVPVLVYEAGEALRFDELSIRVGVAGVLNVMAAIGMLTQQRHPRSARGQAVLRSTTWLRAGQSGILRSLVRLGAAVSRGDLLGIIADPFGEREVEILSPAEGVVIGRANLPLVHEGEALFHIGRTQNADRVGERLDAFDQADGGVIDPVVAAEPPIV